MSQPNDAQKTVMQKFLDMVEKVGNKVPHPVVIFLILIGLVFVLSHILHMAGTSVTTEVIVPTPQGAPKAIDTNVSVYDTGTTVSYEIAEQKKYKIETRTIEVKSLLTAEGIRFLYVSLIPNFMSFTAVGLMIAAMAGAGVAEEAGLVNALIRKLVMVAPSWALTYILAFVGILASIAADAGYLVLFPWPGSRFLVLADIHSPGWPWALPRSPAHSPSTC